MIDNVYTKLIKADENGSGESTFRASATITLLLLLSTYGADLCQIVSNSTWDVWHSLTSTLGRKCPRASVQ